MSKKQAMIAFELTENNCSMVGALRTAKIKALIVQISATKEKTLQHNNGKQRYKFVPSSNQEC